MRHRVKFRADRSKRCGDMVVFRFFEMAAVRHLGGRPPSWICYTPVWTTHERVFGGLYHCAKFSLNLCSIFDNT